MYPEKGEPAVWASLSLHKLTHKMNHRSGLEIEASVVEEAGVFLKTKWRNYLKEEKG